MKDPITQITEAQKISRKELSRMTGIPYPTLNKLVVGFPDAPSYKTSKKLCGYLGMSIGQFVDCYIEWKSSL